MFHTFYTIMPLEEHLESALQEFEKVTLPTSRIYHANQANGFFI